MGAKFSKKKKSLDDAMDVDAFNIEIPFRSSLSNSYRFETPVWAQNDQYMILRGIHKRTKKSVVIKKITINDANTRKTIRELFLLQKLDHPNIIKTYDYFQTASRYYIIYTYFEGINLVDYHLKNSKTITENQIKGIIKELAQVLKFLHNMNVVLRNFDPEHVLYDGKNIMVISLYYAVLFNPEQAGKKNTLHFKNCYSSIMYIAPEALRKTYDRRAEIWTLGVIMYVLIVGDVPFKGKKVEEFIKNIQKEPFQPEPLVKAKAQKEAIDLIARMLDKNPNTRITLHEILGNPWFNLPQIQLSTMTSLKLFMNLKQISHHGNMIDFLSNFIARKSSGTEEYESLHQMFKKIDTDGDGRVSIEELLEASEKINMALVESQIDEIFKKYDKNRTGTLEFTEFIAAFMDKQKLLQREYIEEFFEFIDADKSGFITIKDFKKVMNYAKDDSQEIKMFIKYAGLNKIISKAVFIDYATELLTEQFTKKKCRKVD